MCDESEEEGKIDELELILNPKVYNRHPIVGDQASATGNVTQSQLREKHWYSLRIKFEYLWRTYVEVNVHIIGKKRIYPLEVQVRALKLMDAILILAIHFKQFEYGWYRAERSYLNYDWFIQLRLMEMCRLNLNVKEKDLWLARAWVLYKDVLEKDNSKVQGNYNFVKFMISVMI
jgi:hypothetical protein